MRLGLKLPHGDIVWWSLPALCFSIWVGAQIAMQGEFMVGGMPNPWFAVCGAAAIFAVGLWFEQRWARWIGLVLITAAIVWTVRSLVFEEFTILFAACLVLFPVCFWQLWQMPIGEDDSEESDDEEPFLSLVLLLREPHFLDNTILARLASIAWRLEVQASDDEDDDEVSDQDEGTGDVAFIVGDSPLFICKHPEAFLMIHNFDTPYFDDIEDVAESLPELRARQAIEQHAAWLSVDVMMWFGDGDEMEEAYRLIARLLAELADENCLAVVDPSEGRVYVYDPEMERKLRSENPLEELRELYYPPIFTVESDDPRMQAAVDEARVRWPEFVTAFERRGETNEDPFVVKAPFSDGDHTEFMWITVGGIENEIIYGTLGNDPANIKHLHEGDRVKVKVGELNDWLCVVDGHPTGGFTMKVLGDNMRDNHSE